VEVTLNPEIEKVVAEEVSSGRSNDPAEFLNRAVYHYLVARELGEEYTPEQIDALIGEGLDDVERGDVLDGEEAFRQLWAYAAGRRKKRG
jgi:predicted transcriptional regulator